MNLLRIPVFVGILLGILSPLWGQFSAGAALNRQALRIIATEDPVFPQVLLNQGVTRGHAQVLINVNPGGELVDWYVVGYSRPEFAEAAVTAIRKWRFDPGRLNGEAISVTTEVLFRYEGGRVMFAQTAGTTLSAFVDDREPNRDYRIAGLHNLDRQPVPRFSKKPSYPESLEKAGVTGQVLIEFIIDDQGRVRLPTVVSADHVELASLAIVAIKEWTFYPPLQGGVPVATRAQQRFNFGP